MGLVGRLHSVGLAALPTLWRWLRVLWVCRVAAVSAVGGGLLLVLLPQTRDLFADTGLAGWQWATFLGLVFAWALIVHLVARRALQHDDWHPHGRSGLSPEQRRHLQRAFRQPALLVPPALAILVFVFVVVAMGAARRNLVDAADGLPPAGEAASSMLVLMVVICVAAVAYAIAVWFRQRTDAGRSGEAVRAAPLLAGKVPLLALLLRPAELRLRWRNSSWRQKSFAAASLAVTAVFVVALLDPHRSADWLPRVLFVPILIGGGVFLAGEIAALSHRLRVSLFFVLVALSVGLTAWFDRHHDLRWTTPAPPHDRSVMVGPTRQISFAEAVKRWRIANDCADPMPAASCTDPIVIAAAGEAGPAAFQTATLVGALLDLDRLDVERRRYANIRHRLFALSTASGSSAAAAIIRAALTDAYDRGHPDKPPCRLPAATSWWGATASGRAALEQDADVQFNPAASWRDCFQLLSAGDSQSPAIAGLAYRDTMPVGNPMSRRALWADRAVLFEQAFERHYAKITGMRAAPCTATLATGACRRFGYHPDPQTTGAWLPLLFINGVSAATSGRILASDVKRADMIGPGDMPVRHAEDVFTLRSRQAGTGPAERRAADADLWLSTAATIGGHFPLMSRQRAIRDWTGEVVDHLVDGADLETAGLATAAEIVRALKAAGMRPLVIRIGPRPVGDENQAKPSNRSLAMVGGTAMATHRRDDQRGAHLTDALGDSNRLVEIAIRPITTATGPLCRHPRRADAAMAVVATNWWISQPAQAYLDAQLCVEENWDRLIAILKNTRGPKLAPWMYDGSAAIAR